MKSDYAVSQFELSYMREKKIVFLKHSTMSQL